MISFGERCYSNQYDEISDDEFSDDEISGFANTTKFLTTKFPPPALTYQKAYVCSDDNILSKITGAFYRSLVRTKLNRWSN